MEAHETAEPLLLHLLLLWQGRVISNTSVVHHLLAESDKEKKDVSPTT
jgi:hypothetical protein